MEGETDDEKVNALRQSQMRNMHMALMLSQGTPMLLMGQPLCLCLLLCISSPHAPSIPTHPQMREIGIGRVELEMDGSQASASEDACR